jgi:hypothetical protein
MDGSIKSSYANQAAAMTDLFPVIACAVGHFGIVAKENKKWSSDKACEIKVPPTMQIHE